MAQHLFVRYLLTFFLGAFVYLVFYFLIMHLVRRLNWSFLGIFDFNREIFILGGLLLYFLGVTYYFWTLPFRYLQELATASVQFLNQPDTEIVLSDELKTFESILNYMRLESVHHAEEARQAEQRKNDLLIYLAHDLKTPMTSIIGYLTLVLEEPDLPAAQRAHYTKVALDKSLRLEDLINEFFEITRFNLSTLVLEKQKLNLTRLLEQTAFEFRPDLVQKNLVLNLHLTPDVFLHADPDKLQRAIDNLLRNALSYSYPDHAITLSLVCEAHNAVITIVNSSPTIAPEKLDRLFEQFFRADPARSSESGHAGLGLAITKEIITAHGGDIRAMSADEQTQFVVRLPLS